MITIPKDDKELRHWMMSNPNGLVLSSDKKRWVIVHSSGCSHILGHSNLVRDNAIKVCADASKELRSWIATNSDKLNPEDSRACKHCSPPWLQLKRNI